MSMMSPTLHKRLAVATKLAKAMTDERDQLIREAHTNGASLREIATACGTLTHSGVARIVKR